MENTGDALGGIIIIMGAVLIVLIVAHYTYLIKKAMIERGLEINRSNRKMNYLDIACIVIGLGAGLLISSLFTTMVISEDTMDLLIWGTLAIFGGIGLIAAHYIRKRLG